MKRLVVPDGGFRNLAVLRLSSLGDVVLTLPVVHALARAYPAATRHYWVKEEYAGLLRADPAITHVRALERDARKLEDLVSMSAELEDCDLIVDLHASARTRVLTFRQRAVRLRVRGRRLERERWVRARWTRPRPLPHATARYAEAIAPLAVVPDGPPRVSVPREAEAWAEGQLAALAGGRSLVALCPGARHATKRWPEERWCALDERLAGAGLARVVLSTAAEQRGSPALAARIAADPRARWFTEPLERVAALLGRAGVAVTHDSGLMHLAAARGVRVVALFGSTSPVLGFAPVGEGHAVLCRDLSCQPCTVHGREACPKGHFRCMTTIEPGEVWDRVSERLAAGA
jgi:lipopolysaccharide heptosyltransferase II